MKEGEKQREALSPNTSHDAKYIHRGKHKHAQPLISTWTKLIVHFSSVRPERVEGLFMVRQAHHERFIRIMKIILSRYLAFLALPEV
jgi:hypothetical protein